MICCNYCGKSLVDCKCEFEIAKQDPSYEQLVAENGVLRSALQLFAQDEYIELHEKVKGHGGWICEHCLCLWPCRFERAKKALSHSPSEAIEAVKGMIELRLLSRSRKPLESWIPP